MPDIETALEGEGFTEEEKEQIRTGNIPEEPKEGEADQPPPVEERSEPEEEVVEEPEEKPAAKPKPKWLQRVDEEVAKRRAIEAKLSETEKKWQETEAKLKELTEPKKEAIPDASTDAFGHLAGRLGIQEQTLQEVVKFFEDQKKQSEHAAIIAKETAKWQEELKAYKEQKPDIMDGLDFFVGSRRSEMQLFGYQPDQIQNAIYDEGVEIIRRAHADGKNPAEYFYRLAEARGYKPKAEAERPSDMKRISDGQKKVGVSSGGGEIDVKGLTLESLLELPPDKYDKLVAKFGSFDKLRADLGI